MNNNKNDGCNGVLYWTLIVVGIIAAIVISVAGVQAYGFGGILMGPIVVLIAVVILGKIFS